MALRRLPIRRARSAFAAAGRVATRVAVVVAVAALAAVAEPYVPKSDDEVLERLPPGLRSSDLRRQREELAADPENLRDSLAMARSYLDIARFEGDSRYVGHAQAILGPWWERPQPPAAVLALRGSIRNLAWEFDRALADVDLALAAEPTNRLALAVRFDALLARAQYPAAREVASALGPMLAPLPRAVLVARLERVTGGAAAAFEALGRAGFPADADPGDLLEAGLLRADIAAQLGRTADAAKAFEQLRSVSRRDVRRLAAEADFLLDEGQAAAALTLVEGETALDSLALRAVEAWQRLPARQPAQEELRITLTNRLTRNFEARRRRGDVTALADEVRFRLRVAPDPAAAVGGGKELWAVRRGLEDARIVLEAAVAAGDRGLREAVAGWMRTNRIEDVRCGRLAGEGGAR